MLGFRPSIVALVSPLILSAIMLPLQFPFAALSVSVKIYIRRTFTWCFQMDICRGKSLRRTGSQQYINSLRLAPGIRASLYSGAPSFYNQAPIHNLQSENIRLESDQKIFLVPRNGRISSPSTHASFSRHSLICRPPTCPLQISEENKPVVYELICK